uniref:Uncharacterized protein n=1 Tax=Trichogramma kaykai TaxID=54128 RepID=A0ABD2WLW1_9HYME
MRQKEKRHLIKNTDHARELAHDRQQSNTFQHAPSVYHVIKNYSKSCALCIARYLLNTNVQSQHIHFDDIIKPSLF